ncbi:MAG: hypothetical protein HKN09_13675, partial [Saprospiraceae bacterium]|nr:hypothetical protein [Saprospiraceae bacterium]
MQKVLLTLFVMLSFGITLSAQSEICDNGIDDDNDGLIDCMDDDLANDCCCLDALEIDLGSDINVCQDVLVQLAAPTGFISYEWSTGSIEQNILVEFSGLYVVTGIDSCDNVASDSIIVEFRANSSTDLAFTYCAGDTFEINDLRYTQVGSFTQLLEAANGCDSIINLEFSHYPDLSREEEYLFCESEGININGVDYFEEGSYVQFFQDANGCEAELFLEVREDNNCITCGDDNPVGRLTIHVNKIALDLTELQIFKGPYLIVQSELNDNQLSQVIKEYVSVKQTSTLPSLKDLQVHFESFIQKNIPGE